MALVAVGVGSIPVAAHSAGGSADAGAARAKALPDLTVSALTVAPNPATPGATLTVTDAVRNGGRKAAGVTREQFWLSATAKLKRAKGRKKRKAKRAATPTAPLMLGQRKVTRLGSKKSAQGVTKLVLPSSVAPGSYFLIACANGVRTVRETKATNNCRATGLRVVPRTAVNGISVGGADAGAGAAGNGAGGSGADGGSGGGGGSGTGGGNPPPAGPSTLKLAPQQAPDKPVRTGHTVTATLIDPHGQPRAHEQIAFKVAGANGTSAVKSTGTDGTATFTYVGLNTGADTIVASSSDLQSDPATITWTDPPADAPAPTVTDLSIADGSVVTAPTPVSALLTPPSGATIASWTVTLRRMGGDTAQVIAHGDGPPGAGLGTLDPTLRLNGAYRLAVIAVTDAGASGLQLANITLGGELKLGRFANTYRDIAIPVIGSTMALDRHYDSTDKSAGDFGVGWRLEFSGARAATNAILGLGGWSEQSAGCSLFGCVFDLKNTAARFVTITQPDGTTEIYDMTSQVSGGGLGFGDHGGTAAFTPRPNTGTTGKLEVDGDASIYYAGGEDVLGPDDATPFNPTRFRLTQHDGRVLIIDTTKGLISETDLNGNAISVDGSGVHASNGQSIALQRDASSRITRATAPSGAHVDYHYDTNGDLDQVTDELGHVTKYTYDLNHDVLTSTGPGTPFQRIDYDDAGRMTAITDATGNVTHVTDDPTSRVTTTTDPLGTLTTISHYNARGDVVKLEKAFSGKTLTTTATYDSAGHELTETDPLGHTTARTYNAAGDQTSETDAVGRVWNVAYDSRGIPTQVKAPGGVALETATLDAKGNPTQVTEGTGGVRHYTYDVQGRVLTATDATGSVVSYSYGSHGPESMVDGLGAATHFAYTADGRIASITDPAGAVTSYDYDAAGRMTRLTDAKGNTWTYQYDAAGRRTAVTDPLGKSATTQYDAAGRVVQSTDRAGHTLAMTYDADGRRVKEHAADGDITSAYDPAGRLSVIANPVQRLSYDYDDASRQTSVVAESLGGLKVPGSTITYAYDATGAPVSLTGPGGPVAFHYDAAGLLAAIDDWHGSQFSVSRTAGLLVGTLARPNGVADTFSYDANGAPAGRASKLGASTIASTQYAFDAAGRRTSETTLGGVTTFSYDLAGRLTHANHSGGGLPNEMFTYDSVGNRTSDNADALGSMVYDGADRLLADSQFTYMYDADGRMTSKAAKANGATSTYAWDARGRLASIHEPDGTLVTYVYDPTGRRIEKNEGAGHVTRTVWDRDNPLATYDASNVRTDLLYAMGLDQLLERETAGVRAYPLQNPRNDVVALTNQGGSTTDTFAYESFGRPHGATANVDLDAGFGARPWDSSSGLYDFRARDLDPTTGRFTSEDPVPATNPYPYASSDPVNRIDPSGRGDTIISRTVISKTMSQIAYEKLPEWILTIIRTNSLVPTAQSAGAYPFMTFTSGMTTLIVSWTADGRLANVTAFIGTTFQWFQKIGG